MKSSSTDKVQGTVKQATGKIKEKTGQATNDPDMADRGTAEKLGGKVQKKVGDIKKVFNK
jgi:uncharacterized protein YjbJ (UPF0337 family)